MTQFDRLLHHTERLAVGLIVVVVGVVAGFFLKDGIIWLATTRVGFLEPPAGLVVVIVPIVAYIIGAILDEEDIGP